MSRPASSFFVVLVFILAHSAPGAFRAGGGHAQTQEEEAKACAVKFMEALFNGGAQTAKLHSANDGKDVLLRFATGFRAQRDLDVLLSKKFGETMFAKSLRKPIVQALAETATVTGDHALFGDGKNSMKLLKVGGEWKVDVQSWLPESGADDMVSVVGILDDITKLIETDKLKTFQEVKEVLVLKIDAAKRKKGK